MKIVLLVALCTLANAQSVTVRQESGQIVELPLERYVSGVLVGESSVFQSAEALKAMAVAARTYAVRMRGRHAADGYDFCTTTHCQRWEAAPPAARLEKAAADTAGELLWYQGNPALTLYSRDCGGKSEEGGESYLRAHDDPYCLRAGAPQWQWSGDPRQIAGALLAASLHTPRALDRVSIVARTASGRAQTLLLAGAGESVRISASSFHFALGQGIAWNAIRSDLYEVQSSGGRVMFQGRGSGNGVGLCQLGAERMGSEGYSYREILAFYYPGAPIGPATAAAKDVPWQRLAGQNITLLTTNPSQDGTVLASAERLLRAASERTGWPAPAHLDLYLYPDLDRFRNATGEPGWVAAYTTGTRVHLQPVSTLRSRGVLESTLKHELLHVLVESQAKADLPLWFREGIVEYLTGASTAAGPAQIPSDADLRQTSDASRARKAYQEATHMVAELAHHYGETVVLDWVKRGVPAEVTNSSTSHAPTKSK
jgi:stage II sporulation protein D